MMTLLSVLFLLEKGFHPIRMLFFVFYYNVFALNIHILHIQVSDDVLLHPMLQKGTF